MADGRQKKGGRRTDPPTLYLKDKERQHRNGIKAPDKGIPFIALGILAYILQPR